MAKKIAEVCVSVEDKDDCDTDVFIDNCTVNISATTLVNKSVETFTEVKTELGRMGVAPGVPSIADIEPKKIPRRFRT